MILSALILLALVWTIYELINAPIFNDEEYSDTPIPGINYQATKHKAASGRGYKPPDNNTYLTRT